MRPAARRQSADEILLVFVVDIIAGVNSHRGHLLYAGS